LSVPEEPPLCADTADAAETAALPTAESSSPPADDPPAAAPSVEPANLPTFEPDLAAAAKLCTALGQVADEGDLTRALEQAAALLSAAGLIVWIWDGTQNALVPAFTHGYAPRVLAYLHPLAADADNATAAAFRSADIQIVKSTDRGNGALVAPLLRAGGCIGVLAIEVPDGLEQIAAAGHVVQIVAAQLATMFELSAAAAIGTVEPQAEERGTRSA
jgi:hypothetical protein